MIAATLFAQTTRFTYNGLGARVAVEVVGYGTTTVTLDLAAGNRILAEETLTGTTQYLYGRECLGELRDGDWLYYLPDAEGLVRQGADAQGDLASAWLFDPDGALLEGPDGPVSHLVCGGVYDQSTGLLYQDGQYFDPLLGLWLALAPLVVVSGWRKKRKGGHPWLALVCVGLFAVGSLAGCCPSTSSPIPTPPIRCVEKANDTFYPQPERRFEPQVKLPVIYDQYTDSVFESDIPMPDTAADPIKRAACGATCMAMVLQYYGTDEKPYDVIALAEINGYWNSQGGGIRAGDMATLFVEQYDEKNIRHPGGYGFSHVEYYNHLTMEIVASSMTNEIPLMIGVNGVGGNCNGLKGGTYHAVLIVGLSEDAETVMVVDPSGCGLVQAYDSCLIVAAGYAIEAAK